ncbi:MAG TPA: LysM domain-containing protein, partial [Candidatus Binatia bacterium]
TPSSEKAKLTDGKHVVAKGDTLYSIAKKNGLNYRDVAKWNKIEDPRQLRVGQELRLKAPGS